MDDPLRRHPTATAASTNCGVQVVLHVLMQGDLALTNRQNVLDPSFLLGAVWPPPVVFTRRGSRRIPHPYTEAGEIQMGVRRFELPALRLRLRSRMLRIAERSGSCPHGAAMRHGGLIARQGHRDGEGCGEGETGEAVTFSWKLESWHGCCWAGSR